MQNGVKIKYLMKVLIVITTEIKSTCNGLGIIQIILKILYVINSFSTKYVRKGVGKCNLCNRISFQINRVFHIRYIRWTSCKVGFISIAKWWVAGFSLWSFCWYFILRGLFENRWPTHVWQILFKISCRYSIYENNNTFL